MVGESCLPSSTYYLRTPDYTLYSGVHVCWSEHSGLSFVYGFMSLDYGLGTITTITIHNCSVRVGFPQVISGSTRKPYKRNLELQQRNRVRTICRKISDWEGGCRRVLLARNFILNSDVPNNKYVFGLHKCSLPTETSK